MKTKADFKKIARKIWHRHQGKTMRSPSIMHPEREWLIGLSFALVGVVAIALWSAFTYIENRQAIESGLVVEAPDTAVYAESIVTEALTIVGERAQVVTAFSQTSVPVVEEVLEEIETAATSTATSSDVEIEEPSEEEVTEPSEGEEGSDTQEN